MVRVKRRDLIRPFGAPSPMGKGEVLKAVPKFTSPHWGGHGEAGGEVPLPHTHLSPTQPQALRHLGHDGDGDFGRPYGTDIETDGPVDAGQRGIFKTFGF